MDYWGQTEMSQTKSTKIKEVSPHQAMFSGFPGRPALLLLLLFFNRGGINLGERGRWGWGEGVAGVEGGNPQLGHNV